MLTRLISLAIAIAVAAYLIPGVQATLQGIVVLAVVLAIINTFIKPVLSILTLPLTVVTLGLFSLVINIGLLALAVAVVPGVAVTDWLSLILFALVVAVVNAFFAPMRYVAE